jgi:lipopolysaccharide heptosyltransferase II
VTMKRLLRRLYHAALSCLLLPLGLASRITTPPRVGAPVRRVLVLRFGLLGDGTALLTPTLLRLRSAFPGAEVHVLATPLQRPLLEGLPFVDRVLTWPAGDLFEPRQALRPGAWAAALATLRDLRRERYDLALSVYGPLASAVALLSGARRRVGYRGEATPAALTESLPGKRYDRPGWHEAEYGVALVDLASRNNGSTPAEPAESGRPDGPPMRLVVSADGRRSVQDLLRTGLSRPLVVLHPGATNGEAKRWPLPYWKTLARRLAEGGTTVVLAGGPADRTLAQAVVDGASTRPGSAAARPIDLTGRTTLPALLALLERADVLVSGDSGPLHLAIALGRPTVAIFGPTDPARSGPYRAPGSVLLRHELPCSPCYRLDSVADCPLGHTLCQWLIPPQAVHDAVGAILASEPRHPGAPGSAGMGGADATA